MKSTRRCGRRCRARGAVGCPATQPAAVRFADARADRAAVGAPRAIPPRLWLSDDSPYLELSSNWNTYLSGLGSKLKQNIRNRISRLTKLGEPSLQVLSDREAIREARDQALTLEASGWKREAGTAIRSDPQVLQFYTLLADRAATSGWLRLLFLTVNGQRIATSYAARYQDRLSFFKTGYDPEFSKYAPFKLLTYYSIRDGYGDGLREVDFLGDAEPWKLEWTTHDAAARLVVRVR